MKTSDAQIAATVTASAVGTCSELSGTGPEVLAYLQSLKVGERVIETTHSCMFGKRGTVYESKSGGGTCVAWELPEGIMGTSVTWGTRRLSDVPNT